VNLENFNTDSQYVYFDYDTQTVQPNETEYENDVGALNDLLGFQPNPYAEYDAQQNAEQISVDVDYPDNNSFGTIQYCEGITCEQIPESGLITNYNGNSFRIQWQNLNGFPVVDNGNRLVEVRLITDPDNINRGFLESLAALGNVATGYPFFNEVIIAAILLVLGAIGITLGARALPFF